MADVVTNITASDIERTGSVIVGSPKAVGTDATASTYVMRAGGQDATATITFSGSASADETITIIDAVGLSRTYTAKGSSDFGDREFATTSETAAVSAAQLKLAIEHANGHDGSISISRTDAVLTLTQASSDNTANRGSDGETTITSSLTNVTKTNFGGAALGGGVNTAADIGVLETKWTGRFDDKTYYTT